MALKKRNVAKNMTAQQFIKAITQTPTELIKSNDKLKKSNIWQWSIPALTAAVVNKGELKVVSTCPGAGECAEACYACQGGYTFKSSVVAHTRNLQFMRDNVKAWQDQIVSEISRKRKIKAFRIHDSGDFMSMSYAIAWFEVINRLPHIQFYAYSKMIPMFKGALSKHIPANLSLIYSYGGKYDDMIDPSVDRHSKVYSSHVDMVAAGYADTTETDDNAADPSVRCVGLVYHGQVTFKGGMEGKDTLVSA